MGVFDDMIAISDSERLRRRLSMAATLHAPQGKSPDHWVVTHVQRFAADERVRAAWNAKPGAGETDRSERISDALISAVVTDLVIEDQVAADAEAIAEKAAAEAARVEQEAATEALRRAQLEDEIHRAELHAMAAEYTSTVPQPSSKTQGREAARTQVFQQIRETLLPATTVTATKGTRK